MYSRDDQCESASSLIYFHFQAALLGMNNCICFTHRGIVKVDVDRVSLFKRLKKTRVSVRKKTREKLLLSTFALTTCRSKIKSHIVTFINRNVECDSTGAKVDVTGSSRGFHFRKTYL